MPLHRTTNKWVLDFTSLNNTCPFLPSLSFLLFFFLSDQSCLPIGPIRGTTPGSKRKSGPREYRDYRQNQNRPRHPDKEVDQRIRELDAERDPLSLPEEIVSEANKAGERVGIPKGEADEPQLNIAQLQMTPHETLLQFAKDEGLEEFAGVSKQELIFRILKHRMKANGLMYGEGTLEILPDGFGFLRSPQYHYLSCPDDIYVSPSQIRRFGLQTGSQVAGQIRPPKENERYFALLRIEAINRHDPMQRQQVIPFDELTPLHPDSRIIMEHQSATSLARGSSTC